MVKCIFDDDFVVDISIVYYKVDFVVEVVLEYMVNDVWDFD